MAYVLYALMGTKEILDEGAREFKRANVVPLAQGIAMIPVTNELCYEAAGIEPATANPFQQAGGGESVKYPFQPMGGGAPIEGFYQLSPAVADWGRRISAMGPVAYVEAEFFGGAGEQGSVVWSRGKVVAHCWADSDAPGSIREGAIIMRFGFSVFR